MKIADTQLWIHRVNTTAILVLLFTGTLHTYPDVRSAIFGGYDRLVADVHIWAGAVFVCFPILALARTQGSLLKNLRVRILKDPNWHWRRLHLILTLIACCLQSSTGFVIWLDAQWPMPVSLVDSLFVIHRSVAWYLGLSLPLHLWMARQSIVKITRKLIGLEVSTTS